MKKGNLTGAKALVEELEAEGVEYIFGYPGGATLPIYDALAHSSIRHILSRHEQGAAHMADGYARATGKVGVCMATSGPGATNLVTGIATAFMDSSSIVAITGQVSQSMIGNDAFQEVDITGITIPITKHNSLVQTPEDIAPSIEQAFYLSRTGRKGPVLVDIPKNIQQTEFSREKSKKLILEGYNPTIKGHPGQIKKAAKLLEQAKRPIIIAGGGAFGATALLPEHAPKLPGPLRLPRQGRREHGNFRSGRHSRRRNPVRGSFHRSFGELRQRRANHSYRHRSG